MAQFIMSIKRNELVMADKSGQQALEDANILLLNSAAGVVGIETLKNLILPGVGQFTIVDEAKVQESDLGVNFFLAEDSLGKSRAQETCNYLRELNPEVRGYGIRETVSDFVSSTNSLDSYTLILLVGPADSNIVQKLSTYASERSIPLFYIHSVGFYSHFSVQLPPQFPCVDTHPEPEATEDLRLLEPWPELLNFMKVKTHDLGSLSGHEHGHIPYLLLLLYHLQDWKSSHDGKPPSGFPEKSAFREVVNKGMRTDNAEGGEENYEEAVKAVNKSLNPPEISSGLKEIFECEDYEEQTANFWVIAHAVGDFHSRHGVLPLPGTVPDMKAQSADYIQLQNIYKAKARKDLAEVIEKVRSVEGEFMKDALIDEREIEAFCKGAASVKLIKGRPLQLALKPTEIDWSDTAKSLIQELEDESSLLPLCLGFMAYDCVGTRDQESMRSYCNETIERLQKQSGRSVEVDVAMERTDKVIAELVRADGGELHNISALTGGMIAQEVIKVITKQYIPFDNTCVFDGIASKAGVFRV
ncbi:NEDD8-activating enzyme E1 regulatory subunit [Physcia stellaris]|nr:NEDD8-activating enzyme E1 regulatory subunit [Physcia stellaris]